MYTNGYYNIFNRGIDKWKNLPVCVLFGPQNVQAMQKTLKMWWRKPFKNTVVDSNNSVGKSVQWQQQQI